MIDLKDLAFTAEDFIFENTGACADVIQKLGETVAARANQLLRKRIGRCAKVYAYFDETGNLVGLGWTSVVYNGQATHTGRIVCIEDLI